MINERIYWRLGKPETAHRFFDPDLNVFLLYSPASLFLTGLILLSLKYNPTKKPLCKTASTSRILLIS